MTEAGDRRAQACASLRVDFSRAAGAAVLAPSVHNTQPWRFVIGSSTLQIHADRSRGLQVLDPTGRLLAISCGAAVLHAKLSLRASGRSAIVRLLPDDDDRDHLATIEVATASAPTAQELALAEAIANRHSQREPFSAMPVPMALAAALVGAADEEGAWLRPVEGNEELLVLATLLRHADWLQRTEPGYRAELREWLRTEPSTDGVPIWALAAAGVERGEILLREFDLDSSRVAARFHAGVVNAVEHPLLAILSPDPPLILWVEPFRVATRCRCPRLAKSVRILPVCRLVRGPGRWGGRVGSAAQRDRVDAGERGADRLSPGPVGG